jgi:hypothetical protein
MKAPFDIKGISLTFGFHPFDWDLYFSASKHHVNISIGPLIVSIWTGF